MTNEHQKTTGSVAIAACAAIFPAALNRAAITSVVELRAAAASVKRGESVVLCIERLGRFRYLTFEME
jgi:hypothetical protein